MLRTKKGVGVMQKNMWRTKKGSLGVYAVHKNRCGHSAKNKQTENIKMEKIKTSLQPG